MELGLNLAVDGNSSRRAGVGFPVSLPLEEQGKHTLSSHRERVFLFVCLTSLGRNIRNLELNHPTNRTPKCSPLTDNRIILAKPKEGKLFRKELQKRQITGGEERAIHAICISALAYK